MTVGSGSKNVSSLLFVHPLYLSFVRLLHVCKLRVLVSFVVGEGEIL